MCPGSGSIERNKFFTVKLIFAILNPSLSAVLVFSCCGTNHQKVSKFKQYVFVTSQFCARAYGFSQIQTWACLTGIGVSGKGCGFHLSVGFLYPCSLVVRRTYFLVAVEPSSCFSSGYQLETSLISSKVSEVPCHVPPFAVCAQNACFLTGLLECLSDFRDQLGKTLLLKGSRGSVCYMHILYFRVN